MASSALEGLSATSVRSLLSLATVFAAYRKESQMVEKDLKFVWGRFLDDFDFDVALVGSRLMGVEREDSDYDYIAVAAFPGESVMGSLGWEKLGKDGSYEITIYRKGNNQLKFIGPLDLAKEQEVYYKVVCRWPGRLKAWLAINRNDPLRAEIWNLWTHN